MQTTLSFPKTLALKHSPSKRKSLSKAAQRSTENESENHRKYIGIREKNRYTPTIQTIAATLQTHSIQTSQMRTQKKTKILSAVNRIFLFNSGIVLLQCSHFFSFLSISTSDNSAVAVAGTSHHHHHHHASSSSSKPGKFSSVSRAITLMCLMYSMFVPTTKLSHVIKTVQSFSSIITSLSIFLPVLTIRF